MYLSKNYPFPSEKRNFDPAVVLFSRFVNTELGTITNYWKLYINGVKLDAVNGINKKIANSVCFNWWILIFDRPTLY